MPKMKTHKGTKKRVRVSANGKPTYKQANASHLMSTKSGDRTRKLRRRGVLSGFLQKKVLVALQAH